MPPLECQLRNCSNKTVERLVLPGVAELDLAGWSRELRQQLHNRQAEQAGSIACIQVVDEVGYAAGVHHQRLIANIQRAEPKTAKDQLHFMVNDVVENLGKTSLIGLEAAHLLSSKSPKRTWIISPSSYPHLRAA